MTTGRAPKKRPIPSQAYRPLPFYDNEDWYTWVKVTDEPDPDMAGQRLANSTGLVYARDGRTSVLLTDCGEAQECAGACESSMHDCWVFVGGWDAREEAADIQQYEFACPSNRIYRTSYP